VAKRRKKTCDRCELAQTANHVCIRPPIMGPVDVLVVMQAPEQEEDESGAPGVGPSSALLRDLCKETNLNRRRLHTTTVVKCCPPNEAKPKKVHIEACTPYLDEEVKKLKPKLIVAAGDVALKALTGKTGISKLIGLKIESRFGVPCIPVFHPQYVISRPSALNRQISLFRVIERFFQNKDHDPTKETKVEVVSSVALARKLFKQRFKKTTAFDYETGGYDPEFNALDPKKGFIRCIGLTDEVGKAWVFPLEQGYTGIEKLVRDWLAGPTPKVAHNASFEALWCRQKYGFWPKITDDTKRLYHLLDENSSNRLTDLTVTHLPEMAGYDDAMEEYLANFSNRGEGYTKAPFDMLAHYNGQDVDATLRLLRKFKPQLLDDAQLFDLYSNVVMPSAMLTARFQFRGMRVNPETVDAAVGSMHDKMANVTKKLSAKPEVKKTLKLLGRDEFNPRSSQQVSTLLFKVMKLPVKVKTKTGAPSTGEEALKELPQDNEIVQLLQQMTEVKGLLNVLTQYEVHKQLNEEKKQWFLHSSYDNAFVVTGRISCREPNLMAIPRPSDDVEINVASAFVSRFKGGNLVAADYSQLELRLLAELTRETSWFEGYQDPEFDLHEDTAIRGGIERVEAKRLNFGVVYGIGARKLASQIGKDYLEARDMLDRYWDQHPLIKDWFAERHLCLRTDGFTRTRAGRFRRLPDAKLLPEDDPAQWRAQRQGPNFEIQGFAADLVATAMVMLEEALEGMDALLVNQVHDSLIVDCPRKETKEVERIMEHVMTELAPARYDIEVPLRVEVKTAKDLAQTE